MKKILLVLIFVPAIVSFSFAQTVVHYGHEEQALQQRFSGALKEIQSGKFSKGAWIAYTISRFMGEQEFIGSFDASHKQKVGLRELITGEKPPESLSWNDSEKHVRDEAKRELENLEKPSRPEKKVWKDVAILLQYTSKGQFKNIEMTVWDLPFRLENLPLLWLGKASQEESIPLLQKLYIQTPASAKEEMVAAIGIHTKPDLVLPVLNAVIDSKEPEEVRKSAVFWLGQSDQPSALARLQQIVKNDRSEEMRKSAVFAISQISLADAEKTLFDLATKSRDQEVRLEAIFWIGQNERPSAAAVLEKIILEDADIEAQKKAIFSLSQMDGDETTNRLIKIAKTHKSMEARKEAIFWLAERSSGKVAQQLSEFANQSEETEIQKQAVFALSQFSGESGVKELIEIARHHKNPAIRKEAIFWLGQVENPEALKAILEVLQKDQ